MQKKLLTMLSLMAVGTQTWACNASHILGAGGAGSVYTISADTMEKGDFFVGVNLEREGNRELSDERMLHAMHDGSTHLHGMDVVDTHALGIAYGIADNLTINVQIPYSSRVNIRAGHAAGHVYKHGHGHGHGHSTNEIHGYGDSNGIADISALVQYKVYDDVVKIALLGGIEVPTGKTDVQNEGKILEADLQPGSGSWDFFAGAALTKDYDTFSIHSNVLYKYNTLGIQNSTLGDIFTYNLAFSYKLFEHHHEHKLLKLDDHEDSDYSVNLFAELNGEYVQEDVFGHHVAENTGHNIIFATAGIQLVTENSYSLFFTVSKPVHQNFVGVQNYVNYKSSIGFGKSF